MKSNDTPAQPPHEILDELHSLVEEAEHMTDASLSGQTKETIDALRARLESAHARLSAFCADAKKHVVAGAKSTDAAIRANPYPALAIAAGVGLLAGVLLGRRRP
jgi:ElaB/YqjD/DUF883 family membrane-anchored ribosome-binding protein